MVVEFDPHGSDYTGILRVSGRVGLCAAPELRERVLGLVADGYRQFVVDLSGVTEIDTSGVVALISGLKAARIEGGDFRIARASLPVLRVLRERRLDAVLFPYPTIEDALVGYA